jgi:hypothetical protein
MSLRLIREAQAKSTLSADEYRLLNVVKDALGKDSITSVMESYMPTPEDYATWLDVIQGYARDAGISLNKKSAFLDIAGAVLENDPNEPPYSMQQAIMNKLWLDQQAARHTKKIAQVAQAAEDEERVAQAARTFVGDDEPVDDVGANDLGDVGADQPADFGADSTVDYEDPRDAPASDQEGSGEKAWWHDDEDDTDMAAFPKFAARKYGDNPNELNGVPADDTFEPAPEDEAAFAADDDTDPRAAFENEEKSVTPKKMTVLQQMLTLPKTSISALVKDVEQEGAAAWKQHSLPANPHPKGSMAHKAWERGMFGAIKDHVGIGKDTNKVTKPAKRRK